MASMSLRQQAKCLELPPNFSVLRHYFGFHLGVVPPRPTIPVNPSLEEMDLAPVAPPTRISVSLRKQMTAIRGHYFNLNMILVGSDLLTEAQRNWLDYSVHRMRVIFEQVPVTIGRVQWYGVHVDQANGWHILSFPWDQMLVTAQWTVPNDGVDVFGVTEIVDDEVAGQAGINQSCAKNSNGWSGAVFEMKGISGFLMPKLIAHELGHLFGLYHRNDEIYNLMCQIRYHIGQLQNNAGLPLFHDYPANIDNDQAECILDHCWIRPGC